MLTRIVKMIYYLVPTLYFFSERPGLNELPLDWASDLKGRKLNKRPGLIPIITVLEKGWKTVELSLVSSVNIFVEKQLTSYKKLLLSQMELPRAKERERESDRNSPLTAPVKLWLSNMIIYIRLTLRSLNPKKWPHH